MRKILVIRTRTIILKSIKIITIKNNTTKS
jgi:hypothetical protein